MVRIGVCTGISAAFTVVFLSFFSLLYTFVRFSCHAHLLLFLSLSLSPIFCFGFLVYLVSFFVPSLLLGRRDHGGNRWDENASRDHPQQQTSPIIVRFSGRHELIPFCPFDISDGISKESPLHRSLGSISSSQTLPRP